MSEFLIRFEPWIRAGHIIFVIFWVAGMMYLPRLFVYHHQAEPGGKMEQALIDQERRLLKIIINPAMIIAFLLGLILLWFRASDLIRFSWLWVKLILLVFLFSIHGEFSKDRKKFARGERPKSEKLYRVLNEVPAVGTLI